MMNGLARLPVALATLTLLAFPMAPHAETDSEFSAAERRSIERLSSLAPERFRDATNQYCGDDKAARYGEKLFFDSRLSRDGSGSCATCHVPEQAWAGGDMQASRGGAARKTPTLTNVAYNRWFNWDGSSDSLWSQSLGPIENPLELDSSRVEIVRMLQNNEDLYAGYRELFGPIPDEIAPERLPPRARPVPEDPEHPLHRAWLAMDESQRRAVNRVFVNLGKAIAAFEATIVSDASPFDRFVEGLKAGDETRMAALSPDARRGLKLFLGKAQCVLCHSGPNFSDSEFHQVQFDLEQRSDLGRWAGVERVRDLEFNFNSPYNDARPGQAIPWVDYVTRIPESKQQYKTPTLRNVALGGPYMHNGRFATLEEVIEHYNDVGANRAPEDHGETVLNSIGLNTGEKRDLIAFLHSLTDQSRWSGPQAVIARNDVNSIEP